MVVFSCVRGSRAAGNYIWTPVGLQPPPDERGAFRNSMKYLVGLPGFEPGTSCTPSKNRSIAYKQSDCKQTTSATHVGGKTAGIVRDSLGSAGIVREGKSLLGRVGSLPVECPVMGTMRPRGRPRLLLRGRADPQHHSSRAAARYEHVPRLWTSAPPRPKAVIGPDRPLRRSFP